MICEFIILFPARNKDKLEWVTRVTHNFPTYKKPNLLHLLEMWCILFFFYNQGVVYSEFMRRGSTREAHEKKDGENLIP